MVVDEMQRRLQSSTFSQKSQKLARAHLSDNTTSRTGIRSNESAVPMLKQRFNTTLCAIMYESGIVNLPEYIIRYHVAILGVDHIQLGVYTLDGDMRLSQAVGVADRLLQPDIDNGKLSTSKMSWSDSIGLIICPNPYVQIQMAFNQDCKI
jgi:hypothetical protein